MAKPTTTQHKTAFLNEDGTIVPVQRGLRVFINVGGNIAIMSMAEDSSGHSQVIEMVEIPISSAEALIAALRELST
tara:strand:- start:2367 stop:2594 length:228 start_codon:yes stop_codon:yes gene_type:complete